jgi:hypothetical protein
MLHSSAKCVSLLAYADTDCAFCIWPWQWFKLGKAERPLLVTSNRCIQMYSSYKHIELKCLRVFACQIIKLFSVVFFVVRAGQKFVFMPMVNGKIYTMQCETFVFLAGSIYFS